jgi:hypothetical protein
MDAITTRADALKSGQRHYFTGKPCLAGHIARRDSVSGHCCVCKLLRQNQARQAARRQLKTSEAP